MATCLRDLGRLIVACSFVMLAACGGGGGGGSSPADAPAAPGQVAPGGTGTPATPGQTASSGTDAPATPGQTAPSGTDAAATPGQVAPGGTDTPLAPRIAVVAGSLESAYRDGPALDARFGTLASIAAAPDGSLLILDEGAYRLRKLDASGNVSTLAEFLCASCSLADRALPKYVAVNPSSGAMFVRFDSRGWPPVGRSSLVRVSATGQLTEFEHPWHGGLGVLAVDPAGNVFTTGDAFLPIVLEIAPDGTVYTITGSASAVAVDKNGKPFVVAPGFGIATVDPSYRLTKVVPATASPDFALTSPVIDSLALDDPGNMYYAVGQLVRMVTPAGVVSTFADLSAFAPDAAARIRGLAVLRGGLYAVLGTRVIRVAL